MTDRDRAEIRGIVARICENYLAEHARILHADAINAALEDEAAMPDQEVEEAVRASKDDDQDHVFTA
jgi:hypothetical protein